MKNYACHFCLVSEQPVPNITPTLDNRFKPTKVVLLVSQSMKSNAQNLIKVYQNNQIKCELLSIANAYNLTEIMDTIEHYLDSHANESIVLNITGGTKPMAIAAQEVFTLYGKDIFYINIKTDELMFLSRLTRGDDSKHKVAHYQLDDQIGIQDYLTAYGIEVLNKIERHRQIQPSYQDLMQGLVDNMSQPEHKNFLSALNYYSSKASNSLTATLNKQDQLNSSFLSFLAPFIKADLFQHDANQLVFKSEISRFFCNGGWLEDYLFISLRSLRKELKIQDITTGLEVMLQKGSRNELDVVFIANNRFYIIECKTKKYKGQDDGADDTIYKLDSLKDYAGIRTKAMLVSYRDIKLVHKNRADDYDINVVSGNELARLKIHLKNWIKAS